jgi:ribose 5-phosphate isomerase B
MIIAVAADHGGYELKEAIKEYLRKRKDTKILDLGTNSEDPVDYPAYGKAAGQAVASGKADLGIVCCGTGIGISIAANKVKGVRCALCTSVQMAELAKAHNNANIIAFGGRTTSKEEAFKMLDAWLDGEWLGKTVERHKRRVAELDKM